MAKAPEKGLKEIPVTFSSQRNARIAGLPFGKRGNVGDNGCGALAVSHVMELLGEQEDFLGILSLFNQARNLFLPAVLFGGRMGANPIFLGRFFRKKGYRARWRFRRKKFKKDGDAYIILTVFWENGRLGAHYQAGTYMGKVLHVHNPDRQYEDFSQMRKKTKNCLGMAVLEIKRDNRG